MEVLIRKQTGNQVVVLTTTQENYDKNKASMNAEGWSLVPESQLVPVVETPNEPVEPVEEVQEIKTKKRKEPKTILIEGIEQEQETPSPDDF